MTIFLVTPAFDCSVQEKSFIVLVVSFFVLKTEFQVSLNVILELPCDLLCGCTLTHHLYVSGEVCV